MINLSNNACIGMLLLIFVLGGCLQQHHKADCSHKIIIMPDRLFLCNGIDRLITENCFADRPSNFGSLEVHNNFRNITQDIRATKYCYRYRADSARISIGVQKDINRGTNTPLDMNLLRFGFLPPDYHPKILLRSTEIYCGDTLDNLEYIISADKPFAKKYVYAFKVFGLVNDSIFEFTYSHAIKDTLSDISVYQQHARLCKDMLVFRCE